MLRGETRSEGNGIVYAVLRARQRLGSGFGFLRTPQRKVESGTLVELGFSPDTAAMLVHNALHGSQTHARTFKVFGTMQPLSLDCSVRPADLCPWSAVVAESATPSAPKAIAAGPGLSVDNVAMMTLPWSRSALLSCLTQDSTAACRTRLSSLSTHPLESSVEDRPDGEITVVPSAPRASSFRPCTSARPLAVLCRGERKQPFIFNWIAYADRIPRTRTWPSL